VASTPPAPASALGSRAVLNTALVLGARVVSRLIALVVVVVLANHLGPDRYGRYSTLVAFSALVSVLADFGLNPLYTREAARDPGRLPEYLANLLSGKLLLAAAAFVLLAIALSLTGLGDLLLPGGVLLVLSPVKALVFIAIHQGVFGLYMGCSFAPNHKGMPTFPAGHDMDFLRRQVLTSRNVRGSWFTDLLLGGLNYQVEHHLFPSMPRPSLPKAQRLVRAYCQDHQILYTETGLIGSYVAALRYLNELGAPLRAPAPVTFEAA